MVRREKNLGQLVSSEYLERHGVPWTFRENSPKMARSGRGFVINLDDADQQGTHWVAARLIGNSLYYADPFGSILSGYPPEELSRLAKRHITNRIAFQHPSTALCGYYAMFFTEALNKLNEKATTDELEEALMKSVE